MPNAQLQVLGEHPGSMRIGRWKNVVICAWSGQTTGPAVATLTRIMVKLHAHSTEVRSYIHLIPDQAGLPDALARNGLRWIMSTYEPYIACAGVVIAGTGFWASAMRNAVIGLRLLVQTPFDFQLKGEPEEVVAWLPREHLKRTGVAVSSHELRELLHEARSWQAQPAALSTV